MQSSGDSSLIRRLALSFGEGLVFSIGMKLTEDAIRPRQQTIAGPPPDLSLLADRLASIEERLQQLDKPREKAIPSPSGFDPKVVQVIVTAVEKHLEQHAALVQKRMDGLQSTSVSAA